MPTRRGCRKRLVTLDCHVEIGTPLDATRTAELDPKRLFAFLKAMEFTTLTKRVAEASGIDADDDRGRPELSARSRKRARRRPHSHRRPDPTGRPRSSSATAPKAGGRRPGKSRRAPAAVLPAMSAVPRARSASRPTSPLRAPCSRPPSRSTPRSTRRVTSLERLDAWIAEATERGRVAIDAAYERLGSDAAMRADRHQPRHRAGQGGLHPVRPPERRRRSPRRAWRPARFREAEALARLKPLLEDPSVLKIAHDLKSDYLVLPPPRHRRSRRIDDTMLLSYALDAGKGGNGLAELVRALARPHADRLQGRHRQRQGGGDLRPMSRSTGRPNMPARMPTSRSACGPG